MKQQLLRWNITLLLLSMFILASCGGQTMTTSATMETNKGTIEIAFYDKEASVTTANFIGLAKEGFYDGLTFHRYESGFVIQGGDPNGDGTGGSGKHIPLETSPRLRHDPGVIAMARSADPDSASSQFYFTLAPAPFLDGKYAVFGKVTSGMGVVESLRVGDKIIKVTVHEP